MTTDFRALCVELTDCLEKADWPNRYRHVFQQWVDIARAALADEPAVPDGREPAAVTGQPSDQQLLEVMPQQFHDDLATVSRMAAHGAGPDVGPGLFRVSLNTGVVDFARAVLARWGNPAPQSPAEGEVAECTAELEEQKPRPDYDRVQKIATEAQIRSAAQYLAKKQHCDGDLIPAIRYAIARWGNPAPQLEGKVPLPSNADQAALMVILGEQWLSANAPERLRRQASSADGEVAELVQHLRHAADADAWDGASPEWCQSMLRAAELLQRQEPVPVPEQEVSE